jgi:hypothetical protein
MLEEIKEFKITFRDEDIFYIYRNDFDYKLFSYENYARISFSVLFLLLSGLSVLGYTHSKDYFFYTLLFLAGTGYNVILLLSDYWMKLKKKKEKTTWVDSIKKYKSHRLTIHDHFFKYLRDDDVFIYDIDKTISLYYNDEYFYCKLDSGIDIVLPSKSFENNEYKEFTIRIDKIKQ